MVISTNYLMVNMLMDDNLAAFYDAVKKLEARHPEWFKGQMVETGAEAPKRAVSGPSGPVVEAPRKDYWDHDDADRNDI